jgi:hypothetical protein
MCEEDLVFWTRQWLSNQVVISVILSSASEIDQVPPQIPIQRCGSRTLLKERLDVLPPYDSCGRQSKLRWMIEPDGQSPLLRAFENGASHDKDRCEATNALYLSSVSTL